MSSSSSEEDVRNTQHDAASPSPTEPQTRYINLKVLSPAFEASSGLHVGAVAVDSTIGALKAKICDRAPSHPQPERQRLIYHGHLLSDDSETLEHIFGAAQVQQESDFTLHLVVRPLPNATGASFSATPTPTTATPLAQSRAQTPLTAGTPARHAATPITGNATPGTPGTPGRLPRPPGAGAAGAAMPNAYPQLRMGPPGFIMPQLAGMPQIPGMQQFANQFPNHVHNHPHNPFGAHQHPHNPLGLHHHPHNPLAAHQPPHNPLAAHQPPAAAGQQLEPQQDDQAQPDQTGQPQPAPNNTTTTRTFNGPNGARYTVRVNTSTVVLPPTPRNQIRQHLPGHHQAPAFHHPHNPFEQHQAHMRAAMNQTPPSQGQVNINDAFDDPVTASDVRELAELTSQFARLMQAETGISEQARAAAETLRGNTEAIASRLRESTTRINARNRAAAAARPASEPTQPATLPSQPPPLTGPSTLAHTPPQFLGQSLQQFDATAATVYLLSSPAGPQAVLFAPQGTYAGQSQQMYGMNPMASMFGGMTGMPALPDTMPFMPGQFFPHQNQQQPVQNATTGLPDPPLNPVQPNQLNNLQIPADQEVRDLVRQFNVEGQDQPVDLLARAQPFLAQFWLVFRVMLFAYFFFPMDQGWYRPAIMLFLSLAFLLLNGETMGRGPREAVRGWWEGVVAAPPQRPAQQDAQGQDPTAVPQPFQQQQQDQELHWLRQTFRPVERALALFLASLWPGIGERTVAARRAEEERIARDEREEAQRRDVEAAAAAAAAENNTEANSGDSADPITQVEASTATEPGLTPTPTATVATGAEVGGSEELRERKTVLRHATVEEEKEGDQDQAHQDSMSAAPVGN